jgi:hypothetical protein
VAGLNPQGDNFLAVRSGPGRDFAKIDELYQGDRVLLCDERGQWVGIVYTRMTPTAEWPARKPSGRPTRGHAAPGGCSEATSPWLPDKVAAGKEAIDAPA